MKVVVGSKNPVKLEAARNSFSAVFPDVEFEFEFVACSVASLVADQPVGIEETKQGALNRAVACREAYKDADFFVGMEGGLEEIEGDYFVSAWMCVIDREGRIGFGRTGAFQLPTQITKLIQEGLELSEATDRVFNDNNSGQKGGAVSALTNGTIDRTSFYTEAIIFALIPFIKSHLYK